MNSITPVKQRDVNWVAEHARRNMRAWARRFGEYEHIARGEINALWMLGLIDKTEWIAFCNEQLFLVRRHRERQIGA